MRVRLIPLEGGTPIEIAKDLVVVGRKEECDIRLEHKSISKMHCVLVKTDGVLLLRDLGSTNGTRVNGQRIRRAALLPDDKLTIAHFSFRIAFGAALAASVSPHEQTQNLDPREVARLLGKAPPPEPDPKMDSSLEMPIMPVQAKDLPDVYPDEPA